MSWYPPSLVLVISSYAVCSLTFPILGIIDRGPHMETTCSRRAVNESQRCTSCQPVLVCDDGGGRRYIPSARLCVCVFRSGRRVERTNFRMHFGCINNAARGAGVEIRL
uniref:Putative secreted peptide n=1 Tax=Anopheles braziliensis TaxID=58242 RepID=A0A2M3ZU69_9DIPT